MSGVELSGVEMSNPRYATSQNRDGAIGQLPHGHSGGHAHVQIWSKAKIFQKGRRDFIFEPK